MSEAFLRIDRVDRVFDGTPAVNGFELDVAEGEFVSLLGPSGCGKTTLLRIVAGLDYPDSGRVLLEGRDITGLPPNKRPVNLVFQRVTLFPHLNVFENVSFGLRLRRVPKSEMIELVRRYLELVRLPGFEKRDVATLSGGEAQRVALARALINEPKVLLLDEPLAALDLQIRREIQVELKDIHRRLGITFVYVTHDQEEAMRISDRVAIMNKGGLIQVGTPIEIYSRPASVFAASFVGSSNLWRGTVTETGPDGPVVDVEGLRLQAGPVDGLAVGMPGWIMLRPEILTIESAAVAKAPPLTSLRGRIADVSFLGPVVHYRIGVGEKTLVASRALESGRLFAEGEEVVVSWPPFAPQVLRE